MMGRVRLWSSALRACLPPSIPQALKVIEAALPPPLPNAENVTDGYLLWPFGQFIADHAVDHFKPAMACMLALTQRFSSEFAVRPFVDRYQQETLAKLQDWTDHKSVHVRRWCSKAPDRACLGARLNALIADPAPILPILSALRDDPEVYVQKSVANNLNDIAKDHPDLIVAVMRDWLAAEAAPTPARKWIVKHALRTLIKNGHPGALDLLGFGPAPDVEGTLSASPRRVAIGGGITLVAGLENQGKTSRRLVVDYAVHYQRKAGVGKPKVFKWKSLDLAPGAKVTLTKKQAFAPTSVRALYPGTHRIDLKVNGKAIAASEVRLTDKA